MALISSYAYNVLYNIDSDKFELNLVHVYMHVLTWLFGSHIYMYMELNCLRQSSDVVLCQSFSYSMNLPMCRTRLVQADDHMCQVNSSKILSL